MNLNSLNIPVFLLIFFAEVCSEGHTFNKSTIQKPAYWSVIDSNLKADFLKAEFKKKSLIGGDINVFKNFLKALKFFDQLKAIDSFAPVFPVSAGFFNGYPSPDSLSAFDQLIFLSRNLGDRNAEAGVLNSYAIRHAMNGEMDDAIRLLNKAILLNLEINHMGSVRSNYLTLQRINTYKGNFSEALKFNQAIIVIDQSTKNNRLLAEALMDQAEILTSQKSFIDAESLVLRKALPLYYYGLKDKNGTIRCYDQLADTYHQQKKFTQAKWFYIQSNMLARKINSPLEIVESLINLANVKMSIGDYELALSDYQEAEQIALKNKYSKQLIELKSCLSDVHNKLGNSNAASSAFSEFKVMRETFLRTIQ